MVSRICTSLPAFIQLHHQSLIQPVQVGCTIADGRRVKTTNQELPDEVAFITAQIAGNKVVYSIIFAKAKSPLSHEEVESHFEGKLSKK